MRLSFAIVRYFIRTRREIHKLKQEVRTMALDLSKLTAAIERSTKATEALVAAHSAAADTTSAQAAIDAHADSLDAESAKAEAAVPAAAAPAAPAV